MQHVKKQKQSKNMITALYAVKEVEASIMIVPQCR
jgi:hypothetical protein